MVDIYRYDDDGSSSLPYKGPKIFEKTGGGRTMTTGVFSGDTIEHL